MSRPTDEQLALWRKLAEAATAGPFYAVRGTTISEPLSRTGGGWTVSRRKDRAGWDTDGARSSYGISKKDAEFFASAREAVPALLDEVARLRRELRQAAGEVDLMNEKLASAARRLDIYKQFEEAGGAAAAFAGVQAAAAKEIADLRRDASSMLCACGHTYGEHEFDLESCEACDCVEFVDITSADVLALRSGRPMSDQFRALVAALPRCGVALGANGVEVLTRVSDGSPLIECQRPATLVAAGLDCAHLFCDEHAAEQMASADLPYATQLRAMRVSASELPGYDANGSPVHD